MLCLMWDCEDRGFLRSDDKPWPIEDVAGAVGGPIEVAVAGITELLAKGVARRESNTPDGAIYSARMVREHTQLRQGADRQNRYRKRDVTQVSRGGDAEVTPEKPEARNQKPEVNPDLSPREGVLQITVGEIQQAATERLLPRVSVRPPDPPGFAEAFAAIDAWCMTATRIGLQPSRGDYSRYEHLLRERGTGPPIVMGGVLTPRLFVVAEACKRHNRAARPFKNLGWVKSLIDGSLDEWKNGVPDEHQATGQRNGTGSDRGDAARAAKRARECPEPDYKLPVY